MPMLTEEDVQKLIEVFVTKDDFQTALENLPTKADFSALVSSIDTYAKKADTYFQEMVMLSHKVDRLERWVLELADKLNVRLRA